MSEKRDLAIVGLILGLLGGVLVFAGALRVGANPNITLEFLVKSILYIVLGIGAIFASILLYRGSYSTGGILNLILGVIILVYGLDLLGGVLVLISGVVGLLANEARI
jgi:uncharacterized membrane protein